MNVFATKHNDSPPEEWIGFAACKNKCKKSINLSIIYGRDLLFLFAFTSFVVAPAFEECTERLGSRESERKIRRNQVTFSPYAETRLLASMNHAGAMLMNVEFLVSADVERSMNLFYSSQLDDFAQEIAIRVGYKWFWEGSNQNSTWDRKSIEWKPLIIVCTTVSLNPDHIPNDLFNPTPPQSKDHFLTLSFPTLRSFRVSKRFSFPRKFDGVLMLLSVLMMFHENYRVKSYVNKSPRRSRKQHFVA